METIKRAVLFFCRRSLRPNFHPETPVAADFDTSGGEEEEEEGRCRDLPKHYTMRSLASCQSIDEDLRLCACLLSAWYETGATLAVPHGVHPTANVASKLFLFLTAHIDILGVVLEYAPALKPQDLYNCTR
eukprot:1803422-Amphidinium_carterae.1